MSNEILIDDAVFYLLETPNEQLAIDLASVDISQNDLDVFVSIIKFVNHTKNKIK